MSAGTQTSDRLERSRGEAPSRAGRAEGGVPPRARPPRLPHRRTRRGGDRGGPDLRELAELADHQAGALRQNPAVEATTGLSDADGTPVAQIAAAAARAERPAAPAGPRPAAATSCTSTGRGPAAKPPGRKSRRSPSRPLISLVMPTYKSDLRYLRKAIDSVRAQHYPEWELCIVDDGSGRPGLNAAIQRYADADPRIKFEPVAENRGISAATNAGAGDLRRRVRRLPRPRRRR